MTRPDPKLLELLVCPLTKTTLEYDEETNELISSVAKLAYPIRDGIPVMIASEARELDEEEITKS
jgi:uncharacterized protein YbaR (Trm112 family)